jgi:hypothetical protein
MNKIINKQTIEQLNNYIVSLKTIKTSIRDEGSKIASKQMEYCTIISVIVGVGFGFLSFLDDSVYKNATEAIVLSSLLFVLAFGLGLFMSFFGGVLLTVAFDILFDTDSKLSTKLSSKYNEPALTNQFIDFISQKETQKDIFHYLASFNTAKAKHFNEQLQILLMKKQYSAAVELLTGSFNDAIEEDIQAKQLAQFKQSMGLEKITTSNNNLNNEFHHLDKEHYKEKVINAL